MKNLPFWFRIWSMKRASLGVCAHNPFKYILLWFKKPTFWFPLCRWLWLVNEVLHRMESSELTLPVPRGSVLTLMKEAGGGGIWHYNDGFHYTCTFSGCLVRKKKVWMCWARWLWLSETAFKKVAQAAQTFNWVPSPFHGDACPALLLPLALYGASKVLSVWWRVRPAISKSA